MELHTPVETYSNPLNTISTTSQQILKASGKRAGSRLVRNLYASRSWGDGTTYAVYGTTNADAGVGIDLLRGIQKFDKKRLLISR